MNTFIRKKSFFTVKNKIFVKIIHILKKSIIIFRIVLLHLNHHKRCHTSKRLTRATDASLCYSQSSEIVN